MTARSIGLSIGLSMGFALATIAPKLARALPPAEIDRPHIVVTFPKPKAMRARIEELARTAAKRADADPKRRRRSAPDPEALRALEAIPAEAIADEPAYLWVTSSVDPAVLEIPIAKAELIDQSFARSVKTLKGLRALAIKGAKDKAGIAKGDPKNPLMVALREGPRLFVVLGPHRVPLEDAGDPPAIRGAKLGSKPKRPPLVASGEPRPPDVWIHGDSSGAIERGTGALWFDERRVRGKGTFELDMAAGLIFGDLAGGARSRRLLPDLAVSPAARVIAKLSYNALAMGFDAAIKNPNLAKMFTGDVEGWLTPRGTALVALAIRPDAAEEVTQTVAVLQDRKMSGAKLLVRARGEERLLLIVLPGDDKQAILSKLSDLGATTSSTSAERAPIHATMDPSRLLEALGRFAKTNASRGEVESAAELAKEAGDLLREVRKVDLEVTFPAGEVSTSFVVDFEPRASRTRGLPPVAPF
jgi:hypothetical protein